MQKLGSSRMRGSVFGWRRRLGILTFALATLAAPLGVWAAGAKVTEAQIEAVWAQYQQAESAGFTVESLVEIYKLENAASAVKKLVDAHQSNPNRAISPEQSARMEAMRQQMNMEILKQLAKANGGRVEVLNFGKLNGIRSDKDQTIYDMDGKFIRTAGEMQGAYEEAFLARFGIKMDAMDMAMFDGDAFIPDWRKAQSSYREFRRQYKKGQAKLAANPEAYREAGAFRAQVDRRSFEAGKVTIVEWDPGIQDFKIIENAPAKEQSTRYADWKRHTTARNAMGAVHENLQRFRHSADFIDRMKYFNRTVGDGMIGLTEHWKHDYIFHLNELRTTPEGREKMQSLIGDIVDRNFRNATPEQKALYGRVIRTAAMIESDKMRNQTKSVGEYMKTFHELIPADERSRLSGSELDERARSMFHDAQEGIMKRGLVSVSREKIRRDWTKNGLKVVKRNYGEKAAKKLRWETANSLKRVIHALDGEPALVQQIIDNAPEETRKKLQTMHNAHQARIAREARAAQDEGELKIQPPDAEKAKTSGPEERVALTARAEEAREKVRRHFADEMSDIKQRYSSQWSSFKSNLEAGNYNDDAITQRVRERVMNALSAEERQIFNKIKNEYETKVQINRRGLMNNMMTVGNADSIVNIIQAYQSSGGDINIVGMAVMWELVSRAPGVSQLATLKQSLHDGSYENLWWLFVAWKMPGVGQVKMVFDLGKKSMQVVYDHAMTPLKNDRYSQVYRGYVDKQPAGWSPFVPGWNERQQAHQLSILAHVPGETFSQKRSNMYPYFHAILDKKLQDRGYDPTDDAYWETLHQITPAFFGRYVEQYFDATGDWSQNTTAGLRDLGNLAALKKRLINQLVQDFREGQNLQWQAELAKEQMEEALLNAQALAVTRVAEEREMEVAEDFVADLVGLDHEAALEALEEEELTDEIRVTAEAYPPVVKEGEEVRIVVAVEGPGGADAADRYAVELKPATATPLLDGETNLTPERIIEVAADPVLAQPIAESPDLDKSKVFAAKLEYEAVVTDSTTGQVITKPVDLRLFGIEEPSPLEREDFADVFVVTFEELTLPDGGKRNVLLYQPTDDPRSAPWTIKRRLYLLIRWKDCPVDKYFKISAELKGRHPGVEERIEQGEIGMTGFGTEDKRGGNCFVTRLPLDLEDGGEFHLQGELLAYDWAGFGESQGTGEPVAKRSFHFSFTTSDPEYETEGRGYLGSHGRASAQFTIRHTQRGRRIARVVMGNATRYIILAGGGGQVEAYGFKQVPGSVTVHFPDYGKDRVIQVPLEVGAIQELQGPRAESIEHDRKRLAEQKQAEQENLVWIAKIYRNLASTYEFHDLNMFDKYMDLSLDYFRQAEKALENPNWAGYTKNFRPNDTEERKRSIRASVKESMQNHMRYYETYNRKARVEAYVRRQDLERLAAGLETLKAAVQRDPAGSKPENWQAKYSEYWDDISELRFELNGDVEGAYGAYRTSEEHRKKSFQNSTNRYTPRPFRFRPDPGFDQPDPGPDME